MRRHGVDVIILGNNDLASFSGWSQHDPRYQDAIIKVHDAAQYGKCYGNAGDDTLTGYTVGADTRMVQNGPACDGWRPAGRGGRGRQAGGGTVIGLPAGKTPTAPTVPAAPPAGRQAQLLALDGKGRRSINKSRDPDTGIAERPDDHRQIPSAQDISEGHGCSGRAAVPGLDGAGVCRAGQGAGSPFLYVPNGIDMKNWNVAQEGPLGELPRILKPLEAFRGDMIQIGNLTNNSGRALLDGPGDHGRCAGST